MQYTFLGKAKVLAIFIIMLPFLNVYAAPGAHGPNGEHLAEEATNSSQLNPRFEAFTETFELVGELLSNELIIYLHDYATNAPIENASIEVEVNGLIAAAQYDNTHHHYSVTSSALTDLLTQPGEYEVIFTIFSDDAADLMSSTLVIEKTAQAPVHEEHHHHFPWWAVISALSLFVLGLFLGRLSARSKQ